MPPIFHSSISDHLSENYSSSSHPRARIQIQRHTDGEREEEEDRNEGPGKAGGPGIEGTARLLRRFKNLIRVCVD